MLRYLLMPVPAGMSLPMITFSLRPISESLRAWIAASVSTRVVSWNDAADSHDSVASEALVIPISTGRPAAGTPPSSTTPRFISSNRGRSTSSPGSRSVSPDSSTFTRLSICRMMISMCLSWMDTPCDRYTSCTSCTRCSCTSREPRMRSTSCGLTAPWMSCWPTPTWSPSATSRRDRIGTW